MRGYVICSTRRTGTTYLSQLLRSTGVLGRPHEIFDAGARQIVGLEPHPTDPEAQLASILDFCLTPNGVYGFKVFPEQFDRTASTRWPTRLPNLRYVYLRRRDLLGQAISQAKAWQTRRWTSLHAPTVEPTFNANLINERLTEIARFHARWDYYFARHGLNPLALWYEDIEADPDAAVAAIAGLMEVDPAPKPDPAAVVLQVQRDEQTEQWRRRFLAANADPTLFL
jgi:LPS sulfotransferase NodH